MSILVRDSDALKGVAGIAVRTSTGLKDAVSAWMRTAAGDLKLIWSSFAVTIDRTFVTGGVSRYRTMLATSQKVTVTVTGGVTPYSYDWQRTDSNPEDWDIESQDKASTAFSTLLDNGAEATATFNCIITDASGASITSPTVTVRCFNGWVTP